MIAIGTVLIYLGQVVIPQGFEITTCPKEYIDSAKKVDGICIVKVVE